MTISQFFPDEEGVDLYAVLGLKSDASNDDLKKAYRRLALLHHPDKHASATEEAKSEASTKFQQVGFAYALLSDVKRRKRYDSTGETEDGSALDLGEAEWDAYFHQMFDRVTRGKLDEMKKEYQGSADEIDDLKSAYIETGGSIGDIMNHIPHANAEDEPRFVIIIAGLVKNKELPKLQAWSTSIKDEKAKLTRKKQGEKEAKEAENLAKELGVWDEFYGSGKVGDRKGRGKAKEQDEGDDHSALQALILKKRKNMDGFFDGLAAKYAEPERPSKGKKVKRRREEHDEGSLKKKSKRTSPPPPEIDDSEFARIQKEMFAKKESSKASTSKGKSKAKC